MYVGCAQYVCLCMRFNEIHMLVTQEQILPMCVSLHLIRVEQYAIVVLHVTL